MNRRVGQIIAIVAVALLVVVAIWYQVRYEGFLQTQVLTTPSQISNYLGSYGYVPPGTVSPSALQENIPDSSRQVGSIIEHRYIISYDELTVLDALQVPLFVPSFSTPVLWVPDSNNYEDVQLYDDHAVRTFFMSPSTEGDLLFRLRTPVASGVYETRARYRFSVVSPLALTADVNRDGVYSFDPDLLNLLRNWSSFGSEAADILAIILSQLQP